jgi:hypothetical protein
MDTALTSDIIDNDDSTLSPEIIVPPLIHIQSPSPQVVKSNGSHHARLCSSEFADTLHWNELMNTKYQNYIRYFQSGAADQDGNSQAQPVPVVINLCNSDDDNEEKQQQICAEQSALNKGYHLGL